MKKLFLLIPALLLSLAMSAAEIEIGSSTSNILGTTVASASDGDVIILTDNGPYVNVWKEEDGDDYTRLEKNLTIKAAEGKNPVIKYTVPFRSRYGKTVKFIGIKFDGSEMSHYDYYFLFYSNDDNNLEFENCEFTGMSKYMLYVYNGTKAHSIILKNCNIHDNSNRVVYNKATLNKLVMEDTEISNSSHYIIHNNGATLDSCILKNCNIHNCTKRGILNENATINNIMIDGGKFYNFTGDYPSIQNYDNATIGKLELDGVEFYGNKAACIHGTSTSHLGSCYINNCYFHNNKKNSVLFEKSTVATVETIDEFVMTHSTIANNDSLTDYNSHVYIRAYNDDANNTIKVKVDHCTCYNNPTLNYDHANFRFYHIKDVTITNCIFAHAWPATDIDETHQYARYAAISGGSPAKVSNCIAYNYLKNESGFSGAAVINCIKVDPLFADAANGDFHISASSPAVLAGDNGTPLGAKRWWPTVTSFPTTDFATPYEFAAINAKLLGNISLNTNNHIAYSNNGVCGQAVWKIHPTKACAVQATLNMETGSSSGHIFQVSVYDTDGNSIGSAKEPAYSDKDGNIVLNEGIFIPAAGDYYVVLNNTQDWSSAKIEGITLACCGGAVQTIPGTANVNEAWYSAKGTRADGMISFTSYTDQWVKWNVAFEETVQKMFDVTLNINNPSKYGHRFFVNIYEDETAEPIATLSEPSWNESFDADAPLALHLGSVLLKGGKTYLVKVTNAESGAQPKVISVDFAYSGGNVIDIASDANTTLPVADAWFTSTCLREDGKIEYHSDNANSWIKWNIATDENAFYDIAVNISTTQAHGFTVAIYEDENAEPITSVTEGTWVDTKGDLALGLGRINLAGNKKYVVKVINATDGSKAKLVNVVFAPVVATVTALPGTLEPSKAILSSLAWVDTEGTVDSLLFTPRGDEGHASNSAYTTAEFGKWKVSVDENSKFVFTANVLSLNGHNFRISVLNETESNTIYTKQEADAGSYDFHNEGSNWQVVTAPVDLAAGTYIVKIENYKDSKGRVLNIVAERATITLDEMAENNTVIANNVGYAADIQLTRSYATGVYNTICLPFNVNNDALKAVFGNDVELLEMGSATLEGAVLNLNFDAATDLISGKPYLIRSSQSIVNPTFTAATITETAAQTTAGTAANFIGTFVKQTIPANENNLYLGTDNKLYFSNNDVNIKGLRAYFNVNIPNPQQVIKHARIVTQGQVVTDVELVGAENQGILKTIENGQVIIIRDGIRYNVMGTKIQ